MKKLLKRVLLILLAVLVAIQAPFIYRRYKIGQLAQEISDLKRPEPDPNPGNKVDDFTEYKGIVHAHTNLGGHSTGSFDELIAAANANDLDFVLTTEHWSDSYDTSALTLNGFYGETRKTLFIGGNEIDTANSDRFLMIPGSSEAAGLRRLPTSTVLDKLHAENRLAIVTYPEKLNSWNANFDGIEVFSLHTNAKKMNPFTALFDAIWSFPKYPELMLASYLRRPDENLRKFDEIAVQRNISLIAGTDAHSNIGFHLLGDDAGHKIVNLKIDDYGTIFRLARQHVLVESEKMFTRETLMEALKAGRSFIGLDVIADSSGFNFRGSRCGVTGAPMGSNLEPCDDGDASRAHLLIETPYESRIILYRNGEPFGSESGRTRFESWASHSGVYRVEVYLDQLGPPFDKMPWIISNPIYVR